MSSYKNITRLLIIILCITPLIIIPFYIDYFYFPKILFVYLLTAFISIKWYLNRNDLKRRIDNSEKIIAFYLVLIIISTVCSMNVETSLWGREMREEGLFAIAAYVLLYFFTKRYYVFCKKHIRYYILAASIVALYGLVQYFGLDPIPRDFIRLNWSGRAFSTIGNPNFLGSYLVLALPISMFSYIYSKKGVFLLATLLVYVCLLFTNTRGAWLGAIASIIILIYYLINLKYEKKYIIFTIALMTIATILFNLYNNNIFLTRFLTMYHDMNKLIVQSSDFEKAGSNRLFIWVRVMKLIYKYPIWGVGIETLDIAFAKEYSTDLTKYFGGRVIFDKAHNEYLNIAVSTGIPSLIVYLAFITNIIIKGFKQIKNNYIVLPLFCSVVGFLVQAFFNISVVSVAYIFWIFLGILYKISDDSEKNIMGRS